jgi:hypothetical protein
LAADLLGGRGSGQVGKEVEHILKVAQDGVINGKFVVENFLEILADIA